MDIEWQISAGELKQVEVDGEAACLAHIEGEGVFAIGDICTHEEQSLSEGDLWECQVICPAHGSLFDLRTGEVSGMPTLEPARIFQARVIDEKEIEAHVVNNSQ